VIPQLCAVLLRISALFIYGTILGCAHEYGRVILKGRLEKIIEIAFPITHRYDLNPDCRPPHFQSLKMEGWNFG
jgi:hypothetical protein